MKDIEHLKLPINSTVKEALKIIADGAKQIALVTDKDSHLVGTLTDGDIRRGLLNGYDLTSSIENLIFKTPTIAKVSDSKDKILKLALSKKLYQIPVVDNDGKLVGIQEIDQLIRFEEKINKIILMVGGLGKRLGSLTKKTPKPLLKVGNKPILHTIVEKLAENGYKNITMCVNYKSDMIEEFFKDGSDFGVNIDYILEKKRMGTAGALSLIKKIPKETFFVMNGDLLTNLNFDKLLDFHREHSANATMCVRKYDFKIPYGVVRTINEDIVSLEEKPNFDFFVNAGIYALEPDCIKLVPKDQFYDMPSLFEKMILNNMKVISFPLPEYWLDIGRKVDYDRANLEYFNHFKS